MIVDRPLGLASNHSRLDADQNDFFTLGRIIAREICGYRALARATLRI